VSCGKFVDGYDESPNSPTQVNPALLLSSAELGLQTSYTSGIDRISSILVQQIAGTKDQMLDFATYSLREGDNVNEWNTVYNDVIQTANDLIKSAGTKNPYYMGIAKTIKAMGLGFATDVWGDVPATEAGLGNLSGILNPKFESQEAVYTYIQQLLAEAQTHFSASSDGNVLLPSGDDYFFNGDISKWKNIVIWLQARYANHLSKIDPSGSATKVLSLLGTDVSNIANLGDLNAVYGTSTSEINQWYAFENARADYIKVGANLVDMLKTKGDPRLSFYVAKNANGIYSGSPVDEPDLSASAVGPYIVSISAPIPMVTYSEALFIQAEAAWRAQNKDLAAKAYNAAVKASIKSVTKADASIEYIAAEASETETTITLQKIMEQKYLAMFVNIEAWTDWRRTGYPALTSNPNASIKGIPRRLPTVIDERKYNPNAIVVEDILQPVWWDKTTK
jgi:hypothetical protein